MTKRTMIGRGAEEAQGSPSIEARLGVDSDTLACHRAVRSARRLRSGAHLEEAAGASGLLATLAFPGD